MHPENEKRLIYSTGTSLNKATHAIKNAEGYLQENANHNAQTVLDELRLCFVYLLEKELPCLESEPANERFRYAVGRVRSKADDLSEHAGELADAHAYFERHINKNPIRGEKVKEQI